MENTNPITEATTTSMLVSVTNLPSNAILLQSPVDNKMMVIHHTTSTRGSIMSHVPHTIILSLNSSDGRGGIDSNNICLLTKQQIYLPTSINELEHHLNHGIHVLSLFLGIMSFVVHRLNICLLHIKENQATYAHMIHNDHIATRYLYVVNIRTQNFFRETARGIVDTTPLDVSHMQDDIVQNCTFPISLPSVLVPTKKRHRDDLGGNIGGHDDKRGNQPRLEDPTGVGGI